MDLEVMIAPKKVEADLLVEIAQEAFRGCAMDVAALVAPGGPPGHPLERCTAIALWTRDGDTAYAREAQALLAALSRRSGGPVVKAFRSDHGGVSGWEIWKDGAHIAGEGSEESDDTIAPAAFRRAFGIEAEGVGVEGLAFASRGVRLSPDARRGEALSEAEAALQTAGHMVFCDTAAPETATAPPAKAPLREPALAKAPLGEADRARWTAWAAGQLHARASLPRVVKKLVSEGMTDEEAREVSERALSAKRLALSGSARNHILVGAAICLLVVGAVVVAGDLTRALHIKLVPVLLGLAIMGHGLRMRTLATACAPSQAPVAAARPRPGAKRPPSR